ncbi:MAG: zinc ribbon domain-containing protein [Desulfobacteraceae bacterium]|jgi:putative FmdB family regulatory protein
MPIYEYQCEQCGKLEEVIQKFSDKPLQKCKHCSGKLNKLISQSAFHLKGTGWYVTDYAGKSQKDTRHNKDSATEKDAGTKKTGSATKSAKADTDG